MKNIKLISALLLGLVVAGCGGGNPGVSSANIPLYIDSTNVQAATATAIKIASGQTFEVFNPDNFATDIYDALTASQVPACINGAGNITIDLTTSTGTMVYNNCDIAATPLKTLHGTVYIYNASFNQNTDKIVATLAFNNLKVTISGVTTTLSGSYDLTADGLKFSFSPKFGAKESTLLSGFPERLVLTNNAGQQEILSAFNFNVSVVSSSTTTYTSDFKLSSDKLGGSLTHFSIAGSPYEKSFPNLKPGLGRADILGQSPTELRIMVQGHENSLPAATQVKVDRSIDNGFTYPFISYYAWSDL
jgi:hypothetical protein